MSKLLKKPSSPLLKEVAYKKIKDFIINEEFEPGKFLSERYLIELLNMSKTPIKSALDRLQTEGFLTVSSKQGIVINDLSIDRIIDIYDLRTALETYNCDVLITKITVEQIEELEENLTYTQEIVNELNPKKFTEIDHKFHLLIAKYVGNKEIYRVLLNYNDHLQRITFRHLKKDPHRMEGFLKDHYKIFELLKKRDAGCSQAMREHFLQAKQKLVI